jgi:hypothetical protein
MNKLPEVCKDCAEYGSDFCHDCLEELNQNLTDEEKVQLNTVIQNLAKMTYEDVGSTDTKDSEK